MYKLNFFVPIKHVERVKEALYAIGAGRYKNYDHCSWQILGKGQFRPLSGSNPFVGTKDAVEYVDEYKVEMVCSDDVIKDAISELLRIHPYEEVAYEVYRIMTAEEL